MIFGWFNSSQQHLSEEQLSAYVDGSSDAPSEDRVLQHLANCDATCGADLEGLRTTVHILKSIAPVAAPRSFALTAEMVADLPDGKPLGEPPAPIRSSAWRTPVLVPAAASIAAAVVFALVLVGNLSGVIEQSGSSSDDTAVIATGIGGDVDVIVEEVVVEMAVAAPVAAVFTYFSYVEPVWIDFMGNGLRLLPGRNPRQPTRHVGLVGSVIVAEAPLQAFLLNQRKVDAVGDKEEH